LVCKHADYSQFFFLKKNSASRWKPFDPSRNWPDLGPRFVAGERMARASAMSTSTASAYSPFSEEVEWDDHALNEKQDLDWATVLKRTFEAYIRGEIPNMYGEWISW
jgi:DDB1- and CUL4-associated factor 13